MDGPNNPTRHELVMPHEGVFLWVAERVGIPVKLNVGFDEH
jgi:hypothetical protein